jgi:hypothetical protein
MTRTRRLLLAGLSASLLGGTVSVATLLARPGTIVTKDGITYSGDVVEEKTDSVIIKIRGIDTTVPRDNIQSFDYTDKSVEDEFKERMAKLGERDVNGRIELARWAFDKGKYALARDALESALTIDPNSREATELLDNVRGQMRLEQRAKENPAAAPRPASTRPGMAPGAEGEPGDDRAPHDRNLLTAEQINIIKQVELQPGDTQARINIPANVRREYVEQNNLNSREFNSLPLLEQALAIVDGGKLSTGQNVPKGDEHQRRAVRIMNDPVSILDFRRTLNIQQTVLANCATAGCHNQGSAAGGFMLFGPADNEAASYTNFYILESYLKAGQKQEGPFGKGELRMIDRGRPEQSLLVQYLLPPSIAEHDHPPVSGYRAVFRNREDPAYRRMTQWIGESLERPEPDYGIDYKPPVGRRDDAGTQPATQQQRSALNPE